MLIVTFERITVVTVIKARRALQFVLQTFLSEVLNPEQLHLKASLHNAKIGFSLPEIMIYIILSEERFRENDDLASLSFNFLLKMCKSFLYW